MGKKSKTKGSTAVPTDDDALLDAAIAANAAAAPVSPPGTAPRGRQRVSVDASRRLLDAVKTRDTPSVLRLLQQGASANFIDANITLTGGRPANTVPLHWSAGPYGCVEITRALLDANAEVNRQRADGDTPVFKAAQYGNVNCLELLLSRGGDPALPQEDGLTPLAIAVQGYHGACVAALARAGVDVDTRRSDGWTPLGLACDRGDLSFALLCLEAGARVECQMDDGATPLFVAAQWGFPRIVRALLDHGADPSTPRHGGARPLTGCAEGACNPRGLSCGPTTAVVKAERPNHEECLRLLIAADAIIDPRALHFAYKSRRPKFIRMLLEAKADVNSLVASDDAENVTVLYTAAGAQDVQTVRLLLQAGADCNIQIRSQSEDNGRSAFALSVYLAASALRSPSCCLAKFVGVDAKEAFICFQTFLKEKKAQLDRHCGASNSETALHVACAFGAIPVVAELLKFGADVAAAAENGMTPASVACGENHAACLELLIQHDGLLPGPTDSVNATVGGLLSWACSRGAIDCAKILLSKGFDPEVQLPDQPVLPLIGAMFSGNTALVACLLSAKASPTTRDNQSGFNALDMLVVLEDSNNSPEVFEEMEDLLKESAAMVACDYCGVEHPRRGRGKMGVCDRCKGVRYCCSDCQHADWPRHKDQCKKFRRARREIDTLKEMRVGTQIDGTVSLTVPSFTRGVR
tara:strand:- start:47 stop:2131 length:2085 start_codon:yes stop_codon:yes gene_type:complete